MPKNPFTLFWDRYREILIRNTLKPDVHRWYVAHIEKYIHACVQTLRQTICSLNNTSMPSNSCKWAYYQVVGFAIK
ncbi:MAG: hypothetical protein ACI93R_002344 [Flavobacteriales bacterium]|jgi:hypothetical protein